MGWAPFLFRLYPERRPRLLSIDELDREISRESADRATTWSAVAMGLLDEALQMRRVPWVVFVNGLAGGGGDGTMLGAWHEASPPAGARSRHWIASSAGASL